MKKGGRESEKGKKKTTNKTLPDSTRACVLGCGGQGESLSSEC